MKPILHPRFDWPRLLMVAIILALFFSFRLQAGTLQFMEVTLGGHSFTNFATFQPANSELSIHVTTSYPIDSETGVSLVINGVAKAANITGTSKDFMVKYSSFPANNLYSFTLTVRDSSGVSIGQSSGNFDTMNEALYTIEVEDFNYDGGFFQEGNEVGQFMDLTGVQNVDRYEPAVDFSVFSLAGETVNNHRYRYYDTTTLSGEAVATGGPALGQASGGQLSLDTHIRQKYVNAYYTQGNVNALDWFVGWINPGEWWNYTRTFPAGTYKVYARLSSDNSSGFVCNFYRVLGDTTTANQQLTLLGTFSSVSSSGSPDTYHFYPLLDAMGNEVVVNLAGKATVRAELSSGGMNANYYMFVPVTALPGTLQFEQSSWSVDENGGSATITVTRAGGSAGAVGVSYSTSNGSAVAGADYTAASGTLSWASGDMSPKTFQVPILNDTLVEGTETITLSLSNPTGVGTLGTQSAATLTILDAPPIAVSYALTVVPSPSAGGTIEANPSSADGFYAPGTLVSLTPQPASGYVFSSWSGDASGDKPTSITMDGNKTVTANFSLAPTGYWLFLGVSPAGSGSVSASPAAGADGKYAPGAAVTLTANAASGYQFSGWGGDVTGSVNPAMLTMNANQTVVANFVLEVPDVTQPGDPIVALGGNSPSGEDVANAIDNQASSKYFNYGKLNTGFTVTPKAGATVVVGLGLTAANDCPERDPASYRLEGSRDGQTFTEVATGTVPAFASRFATWQVFFTNETAYAIYRVTFPAVADAATAIAMQIAEVELFGTVAPATCTLTLTAGPGGSIEANPSSTDGRYAAGTVVTLTAKPNAGYQFSSWGGDASGPSPTTQVTMSANRTVTASFIQIPVSVYRPGLRRQIYADIPGATVAELTASAKFPATPDLVDSVPMLESQYLPNDAGENYGQRLTGWLVPPATGDYVFYLAADDQAQVFLSTDDFPANKRLIVQELTWSPARNWAGTSTNPQRASAAIRLVASAYYYLEVLHKEGTGEDHVGVAWSLPGGTPPLNGDPPIGNQYLVYRVDMPEALWTVQPADAGTVRLSPAPPTGGRYTNGTVVTLTAVPASGYRFTGWSRALSGAVNPATLTIQGNLTATANFALGYLDITQPGDPMVALGGNSPSGEDVAKAIDDQTNSKYFNFGKLNTGFTITPRVGATVVVGLGLTSANDCPERDPASYRLEGSHNGQTFTEVASGTVPAFASRFATWKVLFTNETAYEVYRVTFPTLANAAAALGMQIAEVELLGTVAPATSARLVSAYSNGVLTLTWDGPKFVLESTESLRPPGQWTIVSGVVGNRLETRYQSAARFYRLRQ